MSLLNHLRLKALLPTRFDNSGTPDGFADPTFGGLVPNGDLMDALRRVGKIEILEKR